MGASGSIEIARHVLMVFGLIMAMGTVSGVLASRLRLPDVVLFLLLGIVLGPACLGLVDVRVDSALNQVVLIFGSCCIPFDGGASLRLQVIAKVWPCIVLLATLGGLVTALITGLPAHYLLGLPMLVAPLLASTIASTDPATLVPVFRTVRTVRCPPAMRT